MRTGIPKQIDTPDFDGLPHEGDEGLNIGSEPMDDINGTVPPMDGNDNPDSGDGMQDKNGNEDEGIEIYNSLPIEKKSAAIKYMKSMQDDSDSDSKDENVPNGKQNESKSNIDKIVTEITNGIIGDFDMNDREKVKGTKRDEKTITNKDVLKRRNINPFVSGR